MKIRQTAQHFATKKALETPGLRKAAKKGLVMMHTRVFSAKADPEKREERTEHLNALFSATLDSYLTALQEGFSEARAREITHIQTNFDFYNHGWTEMMEFPMEEVDEHFERYKDFFQDHGISIEEPLGEFRPDELPGAPATPEKLEEDQLNAEEGYADDVYVDDGEEVKKGDTEEPGEIDEKDAISLTEEDLE